MVVPQSKNEWEKRAAAFLKAELKRTNTTYEDLAERLAKVGLKETKASIASKLGRGKYPATFLLATLKVIGRDSINFADL